MSDDRKYDSRTPINGAEYRAQLIREGRLKPAPDEQPPPPRRGESKGSEK